MFTEVSAAEKRFRDAVQFHNGTEILIQDFHEGQRVRVLDLSFGEPRQPDVAESSTFTLIH